MAKLLHVRMTPLLLNGFLAPCRAAEEMISAGLDSADRWPAVDVWGLLLFPWNKPKSFHSDR